MLFPVTGALLRKIRADGERRITILPCQENLEALLLQLHTPHLQLEVVRLRRREQRLWFRHGSEGEFDRLNSRGACPRLAAQLVQFEQRGLRRKLRLSRFALDCQFSRLNDPRFQLRRESGRVALHQHLAQLLEAVGDFFRRCRFLLRGK